MDLIKHKLYKYEILFLNMETVILNKEAVTDLVQVKDKFNLIVESLELMADKEFMKSYKKAREQIKKRKFDNWDEL